MRLPRLAFIPLTAGLILVGAQSAGATPPGDASDSSSSATELPDGYSPDPELDDYLSDVEEAPPVATEAPLPRIPLPEGVHIIFAESIDCDAAVVALLNPPDEELDITVLESSVEEWVGETVAPGEVLEAELPMGKADVTVSVVIEVNGIVEVEDSITIEVPDECNLPSTTVVNVPSTTLVDNSGAELAETGSSFGPIVLLGAVAVAVGGALVRLSRKSLRKG